MQLRKIGTGGTPFIPEAKLLKFRFFFSVTSTREEDGSEYTKHY